MAEIDNLAADITAHLQRIEADPTLNRERDHDIPKSAIGTAPYRNAAATVQGRLIEVVYRVGVRRELTLDEARKYKRWLDAGKVGTNLEMAARCPTARRRP